MREPPADLADSTLRDVLREQYGLGLAALTFLPLGHDLSAWVYRTDDAERELLPVLRAMSRVRLPRDHQSPHGVLAQRRPSREGQGRRESAVVAAPDRAPLAGLAVP